MFWILTAILIFSIAAGVLYPLAMILYYKLRYGRRTTVKAILKEIGW